MADPEPPAESGVPSPSPAGAAAAPLPVLSLPLRLGGGALGGCFFFAAAARLLLSALIVFVPAAVVVVVAVVAAAVVVFTNGVPCLCFGTSGSGFLGLRPVAVGVAEAGVLAAESLFAVSSPLVLVPNLAPLTLCMLPLLAAEL